jgi:hypothetical protein
MNRAEAHEGNATVALLEDVARGESVSRMTPAASWDPLEVWLTRIKQPRESAARLAEAGASNGILDRRD